MLRKMRYTLLPLMFVAAMASTPALAGDVDWPGYKGAPPVTHATKTSAGVFPNSMIQEYQEKWTDWARKAAGFAEKLAKNEDVAKKVSKKMDARDLRCVMWTHMANTVTLYVDATIARYMKADQEVPKFLDEAKANAKRKRDDECNKPTSNGRTAEVGVRYMEVFWAGEDDAEDLKEEVTEELSAMGSLFARMKDLIPAALEGRLAPANVNLPIINPTLFMPKDSRDDYAIFN